MKVVLDTNCLLSSHDLTLKPLIKYTLGIRFPGFAEGFFVPFSVTLWIKMRGLMKKVAIELYIFLV